MIFNYYFLFVAYFEAGDSSALPAIRRMATHGPEGRVDARVNHAACTRTPPPAAVAAVAAVVVVGVVRHVSERSRERRGGGQRAKKRASAALSLG